MRRAAFFLLMVVVVAGCATMNPGEDSMRRGLYVDSHPNLPVALRTAVEKGHVMTGMTREMVVASLGWPTTTGRVESPGSNYDCWAYGNTAFDAVVTYLYFGGEILVGYEQREAPTLAAAQGRLGVEHSDAIPDRRQPVTVGMK